MSRCQSLDLIGCWHSLTHNRSKVGVTWVVGVQGPVIVSQCNVPADAIPILDPQLGDGCTMRNESGRDGAIRGVEGDGCEWTSKRVGPGGILRRDASGQQGEYNGSSGYIEHVDPGSLLRFRRNVVLSVPPGAPHWISLSTTMQLYIFRSFKRKTSCYPPIVSPRGQLRNAKMTRI